MHAEVTLEWSGVGWSGARYSSAVAPVTDLMVKSAPCESSSETHESMPLSAANISGVTSLLLSADRSTQFVGARVCAATAHCACIYVSACAHATSCWHSCSSSHSTREWRRNGLLLVPHSLRACDAQNGPVYGRASGLRLRATEESEGAPPALS